MSSGFKRTFLQEVMVLFSSATTHGHISIKYLAISLSHFPMGLFDAFLLCLEFFAYSRIYYVNFEVSFQMMRIFPPIVFTRSFIKKGILILMRSSSAVFLSWNSPLVSVLNSSLRPTLPSRSYGTDCLSNHTENLAQETRGTCGTTWTKSTM